MKTLRLFLCICVISTIKLHVSSQGSNLNHDSNYERSKRSAVSDSQTHGSNFGGGSNGGQSFDGVNMESTKCYSGMLESQVPCQDDKGQVQSSKWIYNDKLCRGKLVACGE